MEQQTKELEPAKSEPAKAVATPEPAIAEPRGEISSSAPPLLKIFASEIS